MPKTKIKLDCVPFGDGGYHLFCKVNAGGTSLRALIDTGASRSVMCREAASKLKLNTTAAQTTDTQTHGIGTEPIEAGLATLKSLRLGALKIRNLQLGVLDVQHIHETYASLNIKSFEIIIGGDVLYALGGMIDYKKRRLVLRKPVQAASL